ncbi:hypothetical protein HanIR_Chr16g0790541 [Helianthus annuus]|nr:hypothetical protein HanIR_Chr16g0790541 [Helianthus annuus]
MKHLDYTGKIAQTTWTILAFYWKVIKLFGEGYATSGEKVQEGALWGVISQESVVVRGLDNPFNYTHICM